MSLALVANNQSHSGITTRNSHQDDYISSGLSSRLMRYAISRLDQKGFSSVVTGWSFEIYSVDNSACLGDELYCVRWYNSKNGFIELSGIQIGNGIPFRDYGFNIG